MLALLLDLHSLELLPPPKYEEHKVVSSELPAMSVKKARGASSGIHRKAKRPAGTPSITTTDTTIEVVINMGLKKKKTDSKLPLTSSSSSSSSGFSAPPLAGPRQVGELLAKFFEYFWDLEIEDNAARGMYFGRINERNYLEFGLAAFESTSFVNLPVIKVSGMDR